MEQATDYAAMPFDQVLAQFGPLLRRLSRAFHHVFRCHEPEDYYQMASIGLWKAHEHLRAGRLAKPEQFAGYARSMARVEIKRWLCRNNYTVRLPEDIIRRRRPGTDMMEVLGRTQPLSLDGPAPVRQRFSRNLPLVELVKAPDSDLDVPLLTRTALDQLRPDFRLVLLARSRGLKPAETAQLLGLQHRQVYDLTWRARRELARSLGLKTGTGRG